MVSMNNQESSECRGCSLLRSNLSEVMKRLGNHDMLVRMHELAIKQRDVLQKRLVAATESEAILKTQYNAMQHYERESASLRQKLQSMEANLQASRLSCIKLKQQVAALSCIKDRRVAHFDRESHHDSLELSSAVVLGIHLNSNLPVFSSAAKIVSDLRCCNDSIGSSSIAAAICDALTSKVISDDTLSSPTLETCLLILNSQVQGPRRDIRDFAGILECCSFAQSYAKSSIDEYWLASTLIAVSTICSQADINSAVTLDFIKSLCNDLAMFACDCNQRSVIIIRVIAVIASCLCCPALLQECCSVAFNASRNLNVIPSILFHACRVWPVPFSASTRTCLPIVLFISCMFDASTQVCFSSSEAAHAVAFLHMVFSTGYSCSKVDEVVPRCVAGMTGTDSYEAYIACKFAINILDSTSIWVSIASPVLSFLLQHFASLSSANVPPQVAAAADSIPSSESSFFSVSFHSASCSIILLGQAVSLIVEQSESILQSSFVQISPAIKFLFRICARDFVRSTFKFSSPLSLSPSEAAAYSLFEFINVACRVSRCSCIPSENSSIDDVELLWIQLLSMPPSRTDNSDRITSPGSKRLRVENVDLELSSHNSDTL